MFSFNYKWPLKIQQDNSNVYNYLSTVNGTWMHISAEQMAVQSQAVSSH